MDIQSIPTNVEPSPYWAHVAESCLRFTVGSMARRLSMSTVFRAARSDLKRKCTCIRFGVRAVGSGANELPTGLRTQWIHWLRRCSGLQTRHWTPIRPPDALWHTLWRASFTVPIVSANDIPVSNPRWPILWPGRDSRVFRGRHGFPSPEPTIFDLRPSQLCSRRDKKRMDTIPRQRT